MFPYGSLDDEARPVRHRPRATRPRGRVRALHEREDIEVALFGGRSKHGVTRPSGLDAPDRARGSCRSPTGTSASTRPARLAASGDYRAVVCSTGGRVALPATWAGARRGARAADPVDVAVGAPAQRGAPVQLSGPATAVSLGRRGRDVRTARQRLRAGQGRAQRVRGAAGGRQRLLERPRHGRSQRSVHGRARPAVKFVFAGRPDREKGMGVLMEAWRKSGLQAPSAALVLVGVGSSPPWVPAGGAAGLPDVQRAHRDP